jgi:hypothetical protein
MFTLRRCSRSMLGWMIVPCAVMILGVPSAAQTITGGVSGTVTDSSNRVIVGATVTLRSDRQRPQCLHRGGWEIWVCRRATWCLHSKNRTVRISDTRAKRRDTECQ